MSASSLQIKNPQSINLTHSFMPIPRQANSFSPCACASIQASGMVLVTMLWHNSYMSFEYERLNFVKMKKILNIRVWSAMALALTVLFATTSCESEPKGDRPELPPAELLFMSYADYEEEPGVSKGTAATYENFHHAFATLLFWHTNSSITLTMALPIAAYGYAIQQEAEYMGDNTWEWSYEIDWFGTDYIVTLTTERINNEEFSILMDIALADLPTLGLKWFDGVVRYDHTHATWTVYKEGTIAVVDAELNMNYETDAGSLKYTYVEPDMEETESYILYEYDPEAVWDASYTVSLSAGMTEIEWDIVTKEGHVKDVVYFGDADWHCWDSLVNGLVDKSCE
jgi:hypothetical protein